GRARGRAGEWKKGRPTATSRDPIEWFGECMDLPLPYLTQTVSIWTNSRMPTSASSRPEYRVARTAPLSGPSAGQGLRQADEEGGSPLRKHEKCRTHPSGVQAPRLFSLTRASGRIGWDAGSTTSDGKRGRSCITCRSTTWC